MDNFISHIYAVENSTTIPSSNSYSLIFMLLVFLSIFYFMIFRPQRKKIQEHDRLIKSLSYGDEVFTSSGFVGKIVKITKTGYIVLELNNNVEVFVKSDFIVSIFPKGTLKNMKSM
ncbi:putative membrane protein YajC [Buchnera aphidicola str. Bp (Baizongia pistaciae)]|uniref:Sec translocon accessory complex subunit YajC n=1 Tax=Buchnera aphidicola subsp. Baizongia pistaciae (strain Bp) TaxID=224915 RepID=YAJC_BUCBP|nr:preprotein translocase subunit YajC [Buchnera aphidicola]Q89AV7.1 RecName: Full=Sec translocon accessory complex subunit YajC [Buchnera aphidicola str. Bp (Baizongia pistaciae)]AAO26859.1 putative membrane protein YajC [Buchnera aphidicola str. Bp (Baizongia pistaciae)]